MRAAAGEQEPARSAPVELHSDELSVAVYPAHGFVIDSIRPAASGVNLLWERPDAPLHDLGDTVPPGPAIVDFDESVFSGGWFVMFPLAGIPGEGDDLPMHGEAPRVAWQPVAISRSSITCRVDLPRGLAVERTLTVRAGTVEVATRATNRANEPVSVSFGEHPCFARSVFAGGRVDAVMHSASITGEASDPEATRFAFPQTFDWPNAARRDGSIDDVTAIPTAADGRHDHVCAVLANGEVRLSSPRLGGVLVVRTDLGTLPNLLLWEHFLPSQTPWSGDVFALELCSAPGRTLDDARSAGGLARLRPGESVEWTVSAEWLSQRERGAA